MSDLLQFQAHNWHPVMQKKSGKRRNPFCKRWKCSEGGNIIFKICLQIQGKYEIARTNFEGLYSPSIFQALFFFYWRTACLNCRGKNLYSSQIFPNKPINCTVYNTEKFVGICIIRSLTPLSNVRDLCIDVLGRELVKETVSKNFWENSYLPTFQHQEQP